MKASDLFVRCLEEEGVEYVFAVPGEENLDVVESLRTSKIELVVTRHEQHAAFMAATYGRLTGRAGVCMATLGPGATNLLTGIAYAQLCGVPLVAITGQKGVKRNWQGKFQLIDVVGTFRQVTKWNQQIVDCRTIPRFVRYAFKVAEEERPGACHLELPEDVADETVDESVHPFPRVRLRRPVPDDKAITSAVELVRSAKCPLVLLSAGANRKRVGKQLSLFLEKLGVFAVSTQMGKGVISDRHPHSLGCLGIHKTDYVHAAVEAADLIITVGYSIIEYPPFVWNRDGKKKILHLDFSVAEPDQYYNPSVEVVGDISNALWSIHSRWDPKDSFETRRMAVLRQELRARLSAPQETTFPPRPQQIVRDVRETLGDEDIICLDNGIYKLWFARMYETYADNSVLLDNALATMGAGLGSAMAAKMVFPERKAVAICGDGGFMMNSQDLETAVRLRLPIVVLLLRDDGYGFIRWKQEGMGFPEFGMDFGNPDFVKYAEAYGADALRVTGEYSLREALVEALSRAGPVLIDCPIDYSQNAELSKDLSLDLEHLLR